MEIHGLAFESSLTLGLAELAVAASSARISLSLLILLLRPFAYFPSSGYALCSAELVMFPTLVG